MLQVLGAEPEVHEEEALLVPAPGEQQVGPLDVLVDVSPGVDVLEAVQHLQAHITGGPRRERRLSRVDDRLEVGAVPRQHQEPGLIIQQDEKINHPKVGPINCRA